MIITITDVERTRELATLTLQEGQEIVLHAKKYAIFANFRGAFYLLPQETKQLQQELNNHPNV